MSLEEWETAVGSKLDHRMMSDWIKSKGLNEIVVMALIVEFRIEMQAKGKKYADFKAAFQTYLTKGYLSKPIDQCKASSSQNSPAACNVRTTTRGVSI